MVGLIKKILPFVLDDNSFVEGTMTHDMKGKVLEDNLHISSLATV
ncbi:MAG: hypothetical protein K1060chlam5_01195 [Candidatus Anoxychlamydiales bacterium]|nr:hypothetical protein [Candidatus Anoxychlamydiales bacterium]